MSPGREGLRGTTGRDTGVRPDRAALLVGPLLRFCAALFIAQTIVHATPAPPSPTGPGSDTAPAPRVEMTTYQLVFLDRTGDAKELDEAEAARMQKEHLEGLESLMKQGKALAAGPVEGSGEIRGVLVFDVATPEEARKLLENDPFLRSGHLLAEVHPWFAAKGIFGKPKAFLDIAPCFLGLLRRPKDAPELPVADLELIQKGHMENIRAMAASGDLVIAGPMRDEGPLKGVFVFRTPSAEKVRELVARDPAVRAHRLEMELLTWSVSKGVLPPGPPSPPAEGAAGKGPAPVKGHAAPAPTDREPLLRGRRGCDNEGGALRRSAGVGLAANLSVSGGERAMGERTPPCRAEHDETPAGHARPDGARRL